MQGLLSLLLPAATAAASISCCHPRLARLALAALHIQGGEQ
jgi:hypothetical protein